jgi:tetratricopeptide (TPR) repeat protein
MTIALVVAAAVAGPLLASDTQDGRRYLGLCTSFLEGSGTASCQKALEAGLAPASAAKAYTLLGAFIEPRPEEGFDREPAREAVSFYRAALAAQPDSALAAFRLGRLLTWEGQSTEALAWLDRAATLRPDWASVHTERASLLRSLKRDGDAIRALEAAAAADPDRAAEALLEAARIANASGRIADSAHLLFRAASTDLSDPAVSVELGAALKSSGQKAEATAVLLKAYALRSGLDGNGLYALASWLGSVGQDDEALVAARDAIAVLPRSTSALRELATALRKKHRFAEALTVYQRWRRVEPCDHVAVWDHTQALAEMGRTEAALQVCRDYRRTCPEQRDADEVEQSLRARAAQ